jgi:hypothetical protein
MVVVAVEVVLLGVRKFLEPLLGEFDIHSVVGHFGCRGGEMRRRRVRRMKN